MNGRLNVAITSWHKSAMQLVTWHKQYIRYSLEHLLATSYMLVTSSHDTSCGGHKTGPAFTTIMQTVLA